MAYKSCAKCHHAAERYGLCMKHYSEMTQERNERAREMIDERSRDQGRDDRGDWSLVEGLVTTLERRIEFIASHSKRNEDTITALRERITELETQIALDTQEQTL